VEQTSGFKLKGDHNLIASTSALSDDLDTSFAPSASKPHDKDAKREQNPYYTRYNNVTTTMSAAAQRKPLTGPTRTALRTRCISLQIGRTRNV
jgi:hypothetical protein